MLIFTDVDGTLLDDEERCPMPGDLREQVARCHQVVLASSRRADELIRLRAALGWREPAIAEDGAVLVDVDGGTERIGLPRDVLRERLAHALGPGGATRLLAAEPPGQRGRLASILLPAPLASAGLAAKLSLVGLHATPGGHWATLTAGAGKGPAARALAERRGVSRWVAIGNAANDASLLREASQAFVIRNPDGHDPTLARIDGAVLLAARGPEGWLEMLRHLESPDGPTRGKEWPRDSTPMDHHGPDDSRS